MRIIANVMLSVVLLVTFGTTAARAAALDWSLFLGNHVEEVAAKLAPSGVCSFESFAIEVPVLNSTNKIHRDLFYPFSGMISVGDETKLTFPDLDILSCAFESSAVARLYSFKKSVFRIDLVYLRCNAKAASGACLKEDREEKVYDKALYAALPHKEAYNREGYPPSKTSIFDVYGAIIADSLGQEYLWKASCGSSPMLFRDTRYRCLVDASLVDGKWRSLTMFEVYEPGYFTEKVVGRYAAERTYVDVAIEQRVIDENMNFISAFIEARKTAAELREDAEQRRRDAMSDILGADGK